MNRFSCLLLIQALIATPAFSAPIIKEPVQPQIAMTPNLVVPEVKVPEPRHTTKQIKPSTVRTTAYSSVAYYQRQAQRRRELQRTQRIPHHSILSAKPVQANQTEATPLTGRIVHQKEIRLQTTMLPPAMAPILAPQEVTEPENQARPNLPEAKNIASRQKAEYRFTTWLKQLTCHKKNLNTTELSWVSGVTDAQSAQLARSISAYVAELLPSNSTSLLLAPPPKAQKHNPLTQALTDTLQQAGFKLVESKSQAPNAHVLLYQISQLNNGIWLKVQLNHIEANRFYAINTDENLVEDAPFSIREDN